MATFHFQSANEEIFWRDAYDWMFAIGTVSEGRDSVEAFAGQLKNGCKLCSTLESLLSIAPGSLAPHQPKHSSDMLPAVRNYSYGLIFFGPL